MDPASHRGRRAGEMDDHRIADARRTDALSRRRYGPGIPRKRIGVPARVASAQPRDARKGRIVKTWTDEEMPESMALYFAECEDERRRETLRYQWEMWAGWSV